MVWDLLNSVVTSPGWLLGRATHHALEPACLCPLAQELDADLEVVLEKKGNMDETHIDQVRLGSPRARARCLHWELRSQDPLLRGTRVSKGYLASLYGLPLPPNARGSQHCQG